MDKLRKTDSGRTCPQCGAELPGDLPPEFCPKCLLKAGMGTQPATGPEGTVVLPAPQATSRGMPRPGEQFGHYRIVRLLGQGGMGAAFEADDLESGRRVALKVLSHTLDSPEARERFFREGRLAASINHPNSVYVFGTDSQWWRWTGSGWIPVGSLDPCTGVTAAPVVDSVTPNSGSTAGGTSITIAGDGFHAAENHRPGQTRHHQARRPAQDDVGLWFDMFAQQFDD